MLRLILESKAKKFFENRSKYFFKLMDRRMSILSISDDLDLVFLDPKDAVDQVKKIKGSDN
jgi:hypothetical protein